jgi:hypothetical protein
MACLCKWNDHPDFERWNNARLPIKTVKIDCRFFSDTDQLNQLAAGSVQIQNILPSAALRDAIFCEQSSG